MLPSSDAIAMQPDNSMKASAVPKQYKDTTTNIALLQALHQLRCQQTEELFGKPILCNMGPSIIMGDDTLQRLVDCAYQFKIRDLTDMWRETKWVRYRELGGEVLVLLHQ